MFRTQEMIGPAARSQRIARPDHERELVEVHAWSDVGAVPSSKIRRHSQATEKRGPGIHASALQPKTSAVGGGDFRSFSGVRDRQIDQERLRFLLGLQPRSECEYSH